MTSLVERAHHTYWGRLALGHEQLQLQHAVVVRNRIYGDIYDANFAAAVRAHTPGEAVALLRELDEVFAGAEHRHFVWDSRMPPAFEAQLLLDGYRVQNNLVILALEGELHERGPEVAMRLAVSDADFRSLEEMHWIEHLEQVALGFEPAWDRGVTARLAASKRQKAPHVRYFIAEVDGVDCGFFSAWGGHDGVGQVEDLFTRAEFRKRGIGTALVARCVDDARAHGAETVLVGPRTDDTPKHMYVALGFRPLCVQRSYLKLLEPEAAGEG